jgi:hypothetical protein
VPISAIHFAGFDWFVGHCVVLFCIAKGWLALPLAAGGHYAEGFIIFMSRVIAWVFFFEHLNLEFRYLSS